MDDAGTALAACFLTTNRQQHCFGFYGSFGPVTAPLLTSAASPFRLPVQLAGLLLALPGAHFKHNTRWLIFRPALLNLPRGAYFYPACLLCVARRCCQLAPGPRLKPDSCSRGGLWLHLSPKGVLQLESRKGVGEGGCPAATRLI